ncbi:MAG TPA: DUF3152 domain-containing protein [Mycobacteriales bacterium]|nr:DUF3152 domain-containing protein [Mycobacteriales bacterium]
MSVRRLWIVVLLVGALGLATPPASAAPGGGNPAPQSGVVAQAAGEVAYGYAFDRRGTTYADYAEFQRVVRETLDDRRGWWRAGVSLSVDPARARFTVVLASPAVVESASPVCSRAYSCRVGNTVYLNDERWRTGARPWRAGLDDYRRYVVNHEVGHWLGMGHYDCPGSGALAPVMQQQSISMQQCRENAWPVGFEVAEVARKHGSTVRSRSDAVAVTGTDGQLWLRSAQDPGWFPYGGRLVGTPTVVRGPAEVYLLGPGADGNVWIRSQSRGWWPFGPDGTRCTGPSAVGIGSTLTVACQGGDGALWVAKGSMGSQQGAELPRAAGGWRSLGGSIRHGVAVAAFRPDPGSPFRARYVAVGADDRPWTRTDLEGWQLFSGHRCGGAVAAAEYFQALACTDPDTGALRAWHFPSGTRGALLGGRTTGRPGVSVDRAGVAEFYAVGTDGAVYVTRRHPDGWTDRFRPFGGQARHGVAATWFG